MQASVAGPQLAFAAYRIHYADCSVKKLAYRFQVIYEHATHSCSETGQSFVINNVCRSDVGFVCPPHFVWLAHTHIVVKTSPTLMQSLEGKQFQGMPRRHRLVREVIAFLQVGEDAV